MTLALLAADILDLIRKRGCVPSDAVLSAHLACTEEQAAAARMLLERRGLISRERIAA